VSFSNGVNMSPESVVFQYYFDAMIQKNLDQNNIGEPSLKYNSKFYFSRIVFYLPNLKGFNGTIGESFFLEHSFNVIFILME
ncbi:MAG: hypothetical protein ACFFG0_52370, partial [Candidatus Thorarchaeota archaeon]